MDNRIPLPTDNIYKFYALFGLLIFIFGLGTMVYINKSTNDLIFQSAIEYESLKSLKEPSPLDIKKMEVLDKKYEIAIKNRNIYLNAIGVIVGLGVVSIFYGFRKWHREIQPDQDEITKLNLKKLQCEVDILEHEIKQLRNDI